MPRDLIPKTARQTAAHYSDSPRKRKRDSSSAESMTPSPKKSLDWDHRAKCSAYQKAKKELLDPMRRVKQLLEDAGNAPIVPILINGVKVRALFDTGGAITLISERLSSYLRLHLNPWTQSKIKGVAGNVEPLGVSNSVRIVFQETAVVMDVTIVAKLTPHIILGIDYLNSAELVIAPCLRMLEPASKRYSKSYFEEACKSPYPLSVAGKQERDQLLNGEIADLGDHTSGSQTFVNGFESQTPKNSTCTYKAYEQPSMWREHQCCEHRNQLPRQLTYMAEPGVPTALESENRYRCVSIPPQLMRNQLTINYRKQQPFSLAPPPVTEPVVRPKYQAQSIYPAMATNMTTTEYQRFASAKEYRGAHITDPKQVATTQVQEAKRADNVPLPVKRTTSCPINCTSLRARRLMPFSMSVVPIHVSSMEPGDYYITKHPMNQKRQLVVYEGLVRVTQDQILEVMIANEGPEEVVLFQDELLALLMNIEGDIIQVSARNDSDVIQLANFFGESQAADDPVSPIKTDHSRGSGYQPQHTRPENRVGQRTREEYLRKFHIGEELTLKQREQIGNLLVKFRDRFVFEGDSLGIIKGVTHVVDTGNSKPVNKHPYRVSLKERLAIEGQINEMLGKGIITPIISEWGSPVVIVSKRDHTIRFCVDYRETNAVTKPDNYPIPRLDDCLDLLGNSDIFSTLDACSAYWQIPMDPDSIEKTTFNCFLGSYAFLFMPFGLKNGPATCSRVMNRVFHGENRKTCIVYLDDCIVFAKGFSEHLERLERIFERLSEHNLKLKPSKCFFAQQSVSFLGHKVSAEGIIPDPERTATLRKYPVPKDQTTLRSFLGFTSFYRRHIRNYAKIAKPLYSLLQKQVPFEWTTECQQAFEELKERVLNPPVLVHYDPHALFVLRVDASTVGIGGHLTICKPDQPTREAKLFACCSRTLSVNERNYGISQLECLAILFAIEKFHVYLYGTKFIVVTDHHALCFLQRLKNPTGRLFRWSNLVQGYDFEIRYTSGKRHEDADCLSRNPLQAKWEDLDKDYWEDRMNQPGVFTLQLTPPKTKNQVPRHIRPKTKKSDQKQTIRRKSFAKLNKFSAVKDKRRVRKVKKASKKIQRKSQSSDMTENQDKARQEIDEVSKRIEELEEQSKQLKTTRLSLLQRYGGPEEEQTRRDQEKKQRQVIEKKEQVLRDIRHRPKDSDEESLDEYHALSSEAIEENIAFTVTKSNQVEPNQVDIAVINGEIMSDYSDEQEESANEVSAESESSADESEQERDVCVSSEAPKAVAETESTSAEEHDDPIDGEISRRQRRRPKHLDDVMFYVLDADRENQHKEH